MMENVSNNAIAIDQLLHTLKDLSSKGVVPTEVQLVSLCQTEFRVTGNG